MSELSRRSCIKGVGAGFAAYVAGSGVLRASIYTGQTSAGGSLGHALRFVPAGTFLMGTTKQEADKLACEHHYHPSWFEGETPQKAVYLPAFAIDEHPVTNYQFALFCFSAGYHPPVHWGGGKPAANLLAKPVTMVTRIDAQAYAKWAGLRLPTEAEWEKAARGVDGRTYPWGNTFDPTACRWNPDPLSYGPGTAPVATHPHGASPYGALDMVGNVAEWCADGPGPGIAFVKGGAWITGQVANLRPAARTMSGWAFSRTSYHGFRCAKDLA